MTPPWGLPVIQPKICHAWCFRGDFPNIYPLMPPADAMLPMSAAASGCRPPSSASATDPPWPNLTLSPDGSGRSSFPSRNTVRCICVVTGSARSTTINRAASRSPCITRHMRRHLHLPACADEATCVVVFVSPDSYAGIRSANISQHGGRHIPFSIAISGAGAHIDH